MSTSVRILTPKADQYIELIGSSQFPSKLSGQDYLATLFDEVLIVRGNTRIHWRFDSRPPEGVIGVPLFEPVATAIGVFPEKVLKLSKHGSLQLEFHVSSPLSPREQGIWVRLWFEIDDGNLELIPQGFFGKGSGTHVADGPETDRGAAKWFSQTSDRWVVDKERQPSRGNPLLCAALAGPSGRANLVHIDERLKADHSSDYSLAFALKPGADGFDVCTDLLVDARFVSAAPVSGYAVRLDLEERAPAPLTANGLHLRCLEQVDRRGWLLEWLNVPGGRGQRAAGAVTHESLTQALLETHALGLATTRSRNRLSLLPTWVATELPDESVSLVFQVQPDERKGAFDTRLRSIQLPRRTRIALNCGGALGVQGKPLVQSAWAEEGEVDPGKLLTWKLDGTGLDSQRHHLGAGAVLLSMAALAQGRLTLAVSGEGASYRRAPLESELELVFENATYSALSMDPELGFETLSASVKRARPWALDLLGDQPCRLTIQEVTNHEQSRRLRMALQLKEADEHETDVMLVDPSPLTVVRIQTTEKQQGGEILAEYLDDADQAPEWLFFSNDGAMTATLPPQGIGEEMIKGYLHLDRNGARTRVPADNALFDFRLTPPALLRLDRTDIDMARSEAPWSLRRLLGRRLGAVGVKLQSADFELLYGMPAHLETEGLRVAELDGFIGRVPYSDDLQALLRGLRNAGNDSPKGVYAKKAAQWVAGLWARPSWWRVYRDIANRGRVLVDHGLEYRLRPSRDTAHPFDIRRRQDGSTPDREPLRGGVDWPFQSRNIYDELIRKPTSSSGSVEGLVFGTLGGEGTQTAAFNNGKTLIITNSRQGRLDSLTLIRIGRIAMLFNKARHVIVYERTTRRAPRYEAVEPTDKQDTLEGQPPFDGLATLRKVREYIEITEPRRRYPDNGAVTPIGGPLLQSVFGTVQIPVRSDWGQDIRDGFVIALRGPIPIGHEHEFPDPHVFLDLARAPAKGEGAIAHRIKSTERLVFFSSTRDEDGGDTDAWPAWPDVDFPLLQRPQPPLLPFTSSFQGRSRQPDAAANELGMGRFTFTLDPAEEAVNLMHGRNVPGLEAKVTNINLARGLPSEARQQTLEVETVALHFGNAQAQLLDGLAELRATLRERVAAGENTPLDQLPQLQAEVRNLVDRLKGAVAPVTPPTGAPDPKKRTWLEQQEERSAQYVAGVQADAKRLVKQVQQLAGSLSGEDTPAAIELARNHASAIVDVVQQQAKQRVGEVAFVPQLALAAVGRLLDSLSDAFESRLLRLSGDLVIEINRIEQRYLHDVENAGELEARWRGLLADLPLQLRHLPEMLDQLADGTLADWFSRLSEAESPTIHVQLRQSLDAGLGPVVDWLERWGDSLPPFDAAPPDFEDMRNTIATMVGKPLAEALLAKAQELLKAMADELAGLKLQELMKTAAGAVDDWAAELRKKLQDPSATVASLRAALVDQATALGTAVGNAAMNVQAELKDAFQKISLPGLQGSMNALSSFRQTTEAALGQILSQLSANLGDLERTVREQAEIAEIHAQAAGRQLEDWARTSLGPTIDIAKENVGAGLETLRMLAEGPVTDALRSSRDLVGYYYNQAEQALRLTRASAYFNALGQDVLNSLSASMPFDRLRDRLMGMLDGLAVRDLFPDFCGIKLTYFLPDLDVPLDGSHEYEWIKLLHGFEKERMRAWAKVSVNKQFETDATLFDLGPVKLRLLKPHFIAESDIGAAQDGTRWQRTAASLDADFELSLNDKPMVTLREASLHFDERGELRFDFDSEKLELSPELKFITDALQYLKPQVEGATITPLLPMGVSAALSLPLPDIGTGAFTLTGVTLNTHLDLLISDGFEISTGLWLSKPDRPFGLAVLFLGGGGWFGIDATYKPPSRFVTRVSVGVSAGAFIAVNFGFASGSAGILFTGGVDFYRDWQSGSGSTAISVGLIIWGEFSVLGIASASIRMVLRITYEERGGMSATGTFSVSIRICWCFTLRVSRTARKQFSGAGNSGNSATRASAIGAKAMELAAMSPSSPPAALPAAPHATDFKSNEVPDYGSLPAPDVVVAVNDFFATLAVYRE
jgi:hypothetical protein